MMEQKLIRKLRLSLLLAVSGSLIVIGVTGFGSWYVSQLAAQIRATNTKANLALTRPEKLKAVRQDYNQIKPDRPLLDASLPPNQFESLLPFTNSLSNLAVRLGITSAAVNFTSDTPLTSSNGQPYLTFEVTFRAQLALYRQYLIDFEQLPYFVEIETASLTDATNIKGLSNAKITARLYVRSQT